MSTTPTLPPNSPDAQPKKTSLIWWLLGLLGIGIAVLALGGMLVASYVMRNVQVQQAGGQVEVQTPVGSLKVDPTGGTDPGLPVYPEAKVTDPGATVEISSPADEQLTIVAARYLTADPIAKVDEWYQKELGPAFTREGSGVMIRKKGIVGITVKSTDIAFISEEKEALRVVVLERKGIQTEIALARIGRGETQ